MLVQAAGGVGQLLSRWAVHLGAKVIGTVAHAGQAEAAERAGCTRVLDSRRDDVVRCVREATGGAGVLAVAAPRHFALAAAAQAHRVLEAEGATTPLLLVP